MVTKVVDRAVEALNLAAGVARHVIWYVSYHVDGKGRVDESDGPAKRASR